VNGFASIRASRESQPRAMSISAGSAEMNKTGTSGRMDRAVETMSAAAALAATARDNPCEAAVLARCAAEVADALMQERRSRMLRSGVTGPTNDLYGVSRRADDLRTQVRRMPRSPRAHEHCHACSDAYRLRVTRSDVGFGMVSAQVATPAAVWTSQSGADR
jgi:hypothetical protein